MKWEYHVEEFSIGDRIWPDTGREAMDLLKQRLNGLGGEGWELISYDFAPLYGETAEQLRGHVPLLFFKRPV